MEYDLQEIYVQDVYAVKRILLSFPLLGEALNKVVQSQVHSRWHQVRKEIENVMGHI